MESIYANDELESSKMSQRGPRSSKRRFPRAAVWFLVILSFLLLAGIIGLSVHYRVSAHHDGGNLLSSLTDLLNANRNETTEEQQRLQSLVKQRLSTIEASLTERLQDRENQLNVKLTKITKDLGRLPCLITQNRTCPGGWKVFDCSCYRFSTLTKTWDESRQDCRDRGADLVIVDRFGEQEFLTKNIKASSWIGLSDRDNEGTWKWTDGTPLTQAYWGSPPDNGGGDPRFGEEDCGQIVSDRAKEKNWNDENCDRSRRWICEK